MPFGDYGHYQRFHTSRNFDLAVLTSTDYSSATALITARSASHTLYIQKIEVSITDYSAKTWTFQDSAGTPVKFGLISIPAAAEAHVSESGTIVFDFGPAGTPVTLGKDLNMIMSAAGAGGRIHIEAYEKLGAAVAIATTN